MDRGYEERDREEELSLRALSEAFSEVMDRASSSYSPRSEESESSIQPIEGGRSLYQTSQIAALRSNVPSCSPDQGEDSGLPLATEEAHPVEITPLTILEAMLFVGDPNNQPIEPETVASVIRNVRPEEVPELVRELNRRYEAAGCPYHIVSQGRGYRMTLRRSYGHLRERFYARLRETKLSQAAIDVLAIVAYQQPITADQVQQLRGKPSGHILAHLVQRQLLRIQRAQDGSRKAYYYTTDRFLALFGLENLEDLPKTEDIERR